MSLIPRSSIFDVDSIFEDLFPAVSSVKRAPGADHFLPNVDIEEHENSVLIKADLPGMNKEDIHVSLHDGVLSIEAQHKEQSEQEEAGRVIRRERRVGRYARSFTVAKGITENDITGQFSDGVLTLVIPKMTAADKQPQKIEIN
jgi:HSP20 family protein